MPYYTILYYGMVMVMVMVVVVVMVMVTVMVWYELLRYMVL